MLTSWEKGEKHFGFFIWKVFPHRVWMRIFQLVNFYSGFSVHLSNVCIMYFSQCLMWYYLFICFLPFQYFMLCCFFADPLLMHECIYIYIWSFLCVWCCGPPHVITSLLSGPWPNKVPVIPVLIGVCVTGASNSLTPTNSPLVETYMWMQRIGQIHAIFFSAVSI